MIEKTCVICKNNFIIVNVRGGRKICSESCRKKRNREWQLKFYLTNLEEQKKCFHYTNLQPLWAEENLMKRDKISK